HPEMTRRRSNCLRRYDAFHFSRRRLHSKRPAYRAGCNGNGPASMTFAVALLLMCSLDALIVLQAILAHIAVNCRLLRSMRMSCGTLSAENKVARMPTFCFAKALPR